MSCSQPFQIPDLYYNKLYHTNKLQGFPSRYITIPCGWCLNCRKDRQNYFADRAKYEYKKRLTASFVTFTYDDPHLFSECIPDVEFPDMIEGSQIPYTTITYEHFRYT